LSGVSSRWDEPRTKDETVYNIIKQSDSFIVNLSETWSVDVEEFQILYLAVMMTMKFRDLLRTNKDDVILMMMMMMLMLFTTDMETAIMHRLQNSILQQSSLLIDVVQYAAELDWLVSS